MALLCVPLSLRTRGKQRGRESFLIVQAKACPNALPHFDFILAPHPSRLKVHVLLVSWTVDGLAADVMHGRAS